jgi:SAM-dependent methyltransferase
MSKYQLVPDAIPLLLQLSMPVERQDVIARVAQQSGIPERRIDELFRNLIEAGLLSEERGGVQASGFSFGFSNWSVHRHILGDGARTTSFRRGIESLVRKGDTVIDVGSGSGILSFFAARAGAGRVLGLENSRVIGDAREIAGSNGLADVVEFIEGDAHSFSAEVTADVVMGEWIGMFLLDEWRHFDAFANVRDKCLRKGGRVLPERVRLFLSPVDDNRLHMQFGLGFWEKQIYGFDFSLARSRQLQSLRSFTVEADPRTLIGEPWQILDLDCYTANSRAYFFSAEREDKMTQPATVHGFVGYFEISLAPGVVLDTSPRSQWTHWQQTYFPVESFSVQADDILFTKVETFADEVSGSPSMRLTVRLSRGGSKTLERRYIYPVGDHQLIDI